jgi:peptidoglycan/xylan/chitin deacetylase (PgdA/CDA1 family)
LITRRSFAAGAVSVIGGLAADLGGGLPAAARLPGFAWPDGRRGAVSLTYDDGLDSQIENAVPDLRAAGFKATFFLTRENMQARLADWQGVFGLGHEVGNHSVTHPCQLRGCTSTRFGDEEIAPMEAFLDDNFSADRFRSYAYPCGFIGLGQGSLRQRIASYEHALRGRISAARTVSGLANDPLRVAGDPFMLHAYEPTYDVDDPRRAYRYVRRTLAAGGWAILVFHDVVGTRGQEGETSRASHRAILAWLADQPAWIAPMGEVFQYVAARTAADAPSVARRQPRHPGHARA